MRKKKFKKPRPSCQLSNKLVLCPRFEYLEIDLYKVFPRIQKHIHMAGSWSVCCLARSPLKFPLHSQIFHIEENHRLDIICWRNWGQVPLTGLRALELCPFDTMQLPGRVLLGGRGVRQYGTCPLGHWRPGAENCSRESWPVTLPSALGWEYSLDEDEFDPIIWGSPTAEHISSLYVTTSGLVCGLSHSSQEGTLWEWCDSITAGGLQGQTFLSLLLWVIYAFLSGGSVGTQTPFEVTEKNISALRPMLLKCIYWGDGIAQW